MQNVTVRRKVVVHVNVEYWPCVLSFKKFKNTYLAGKSERIFITTPEFLLVHKLCQTVDQTFGY